MTIKTFLIKVFRKLRLIRVVKVREVSRPYELHIPAKDRFKGQVVVVTGGSGVIGRAIAYRMAAEGAKVYVCGTRPTSVQPVVDEIRKDGLIAEPLVFNLTDEQSIVDAFNSVAEAEGKIDFLCCCAGGGARKDMKPFIRQSAEVIDSVLNINLRGGMLCTREACKHMVPKHQGNIVIISSTVGVCGMPSYSEYAAAKAGLMAFVKSIAMELGKDGIRINCVTPGIVERGTIDDLKLEHISKTNWLNDYGKPEDISAMVAYLNTEEASFITGQNFIVDGGRSLGLKNN